MPLHCVFFQPGDSCPCRVLHASAPGDLPAGIAPLLADRYCASGRFIICPIFLRFERSLSRAHEELSSFAIPNAPDEPENTGVHLRRRRTRRVVSH